MLKVAYTLVAGVYHPNIPMLKERKKVRNKEGKRTRRKEKRKERKEGRGERGKERRA